MLITTKETISKGTMVMVGFLTLESEKKKKLRWKLKVGMERGNARIGLVGAATVESENYPVCSILGRHS